MLTYTIAIATRNRQAALRLSIPRMIQQSRPPSQMIIIDSSDDHEKTLEAISATLGDCSIDLTVKKSSTGLTLQRNLALDLIKHPVVIYPDDDSILFPDAAAEILNVYERDTESRIAGVCAAESTVPPENWNLTDQSAYKLPNNHVFQQKIAPARFRFENPFFPDPARVLGKSFYPPQESLPSWFPAEDVIPVEWMTGFRMSYRTDVIRQVRFDERLTQYCLFEDIDASYGAWKHGMVVGARKAKIYHYRSPENRDAGRRLGAYQLLNKAYVIAKHSGVEAEARSKAVRFFRYKLLQYRLSARGDFARARYQGATEACPYAIKILRAQPADAMNVYLNAIDELTSVKHHE